MTKPTLLILAAGMGSRYGGLKQIDPVGPAGETIIDYSIYDALRADFGKLVFVIRHDFEQDVQGNRRRAVREARAGGIRLSGIGQAAAGIFRSRRAHQAVGHDARDSHGRDVIQEPFAAINADDFYGAQAYRLLAEHFNSGTADYAMVGFILRNTLSEHGTVARGVSRVNGNNYLTSVVEMMKIEPDGNGAKNTGADGKIIKFTGDEAVSMNFWGFTPAVFEQLRTQFTAFLKKSGQEEKSECYIPSTMNELITAGRAKVKVLRTSDSWFGVTYREDRPRVVESIRKLIARGDYPEKLWQAAI